MVRVFGDTVFTDKHGKQVLGYNMDDYLKYNLDNFLIKGVSHGHDAVVLITGLEGCMSERTKIKTSNGLKQIKDMKDLSLIKAWDWASNKVVDTFARKVYTGIKECFIIQFKDLSTIICTKDHEFFKVNKSYEKDKTNESVPMEKLKIGDYLYARNKVKKQIKDIQFYKKEKTYDLQVPHYNNFIVENNIITHNSGKSTFAQILGHYCDSTHHLKLKNILFDGQSLMRAIDEAEPQTAIIYDESIIDMSSGDSATDMQKTLIKKFTLIRKKRLFIFLVIPSIFMLRRYFAIFRTRAMINCYCPDGITRGFFRFYSFNTKKKIYINGYKEMDMGVAKPDFRGRFPDTYGYFVDAEAYEAKKDKAIFLLTQDKGSVESKYRAYFEEYKAKVAQQVTEFKEEMKQRQIRYFDKCRENVVNIKTKYQDDFNLLRKAQIDTKTSTDKKKLVMFEKNYQKLLFFTYKKLKDYHDDMTPMIFRAMLIENSISRDSLAKLKGDLTAGEGHAKIEQYQTGVI